MLSNYKKIPLNPFKIIKELISYVSELFQDVFQGPPWYQIKPLCSHIKAALCNFTGNEMLFLAAYLQQGTV